MRFSELTESIASIVEGVEDSQKPHDIGHLHETTVVSEFNNKTGAKQPKGLNATHAEFSKKVDSTIIKKNVKTRGTETAHAIHEHQRSLGITPTHAEHVGKKGHLTDMLVHGIDVNNNPTATRYSLKIGEDKKTNLPAATRNVSNRIFGTKTPTNASREEHLNHIHEKLSKMDEHDLKGVLSKISGNAEDADKEKSADYEVKNRGNLRDRNGTPGRISVTDIDRRFHPDRVHKIEYKGRSGENTLHMHVHMLNTDGTTTKHRVSIFGHTDGRTQFVSSEV